MELKHYFSLALRIIGLLALAHGLRDLVQFALLLLNYTNTQSSFGYYLILGLLYSVVGIYLLRGAPLIVRFAYPTSRDSASRDYVADPPDADRV
jgi:hypothetical protein